MCAALEFRASATEPVTNDAVRDAVLAAFETKDAAERARFEKAVDRFMSQHAAGILDMRPGGTPPAVEPPPTEKGVTSVVADTQTGAQAVEALLATIATDFVRIE